MASEAFGSPLSTVDEQPPRWAWWLLLLAGVCTLVVGVLLLVWPNRTLNTIAVIAGIYLLVVGAIWIGVSLGTRESRGGGLLRGTLALLAGVIVIRHPSGSLTVVALAIGICLLLVGVMELAGAVESSERRGWRILLGLVDLAIGVVIVAWPQFGVVSLAVVLGISLLLRGAAEAALAVVALIALRDVTGSPD